MPDDAIPPGTDWRDLPDAGTYRDPRGPGASNAPAISNEAREAWDQLGRAIQQVGRDLTAALQPAIDALGSWRVSPGRSWTYTGEDARHADTRKPPADPRLRGAAFARHGRRR